LIIDETVKSLLNHNKIKNYWRKTNFADKIHTMETLKEIIRNSQDDKDILLNKPFIVRDNWKTKFSSLPVGFGKYRYIVPLQIVETEKNIYIDRRSAFKKQSLISIIPSIIIGIVPLYFAYIKGIPFLYLFSLFSFLMPFVNYIISSKNKSILKIPKKWIIQDTETKNERTIKGKIPPGKTCILHTSTPSSKFISKLETILKINKEFSITLKRIS
jgi:hypothetical protein